jgi:hypothetical protein
MSQAKVETIWIVVKASRGIPCFVEAYFDGQLAYMREQALRGVMHAEYDATDVFEVCIRDSLPPAPVPRHHKYQDR